MPTPWQDLQPHIGLAGVALGPFLRGGVDNPRDHPVSLLDGEELLFAENLSADHAAIVSNTVSLGHIPDGPEVFAVHAGPDIGFVQIVLDSLQTTEQLHELKQQVDAVLLAHFGEHPHTSDGYPVNRVLWWHCIVKAPTLDYSTVPAGLTDIARGSGGSFAIRSGRSLVEGHGVGSIEVLRGVQLGLMAATATWIEADRADRLADGIDPNSPDPEAISSLGRAILRCNTRLREARYLDGTARVAHEFALHEWTILGAVEGAMQRLAGLQRDLELANEQRRKLVLDVITSIASVVSAVLVLDFMASPSFEITNPVRATIGVAAVLAALAVSLRLPRSRTRSHGRAEPRKR